MANSLPPRHNNKKIIKMSKFSQFLNATEEMINNNSCYSIYIENIQLLKDNFDVLLKIVNCGKYDYICSHDFECLKFIEENLKDKETISLVLVDDLENRDRSYIDTKEFEKTTFVLPCVYLMWNPQIGNNVMISSYFMKNTFYPTIINGFSNISVETLKRIKDFILNLEKYSNLTNVDKLIVVSNLIQSKTQYIDNGNISYANNCQYITDSKGHIVEMNVHSASNVILEHFGVCDGITNATTMLLNNPILNVNVRSVLGLGHAWNVVELDGKFYYVDNTWNITRNESKYFESLKAKSFSSDYLLFGLEKAEKIGHHDSITVTPNVEIKNYSPESIDERVKQLRKTICFSNYDKPLFESRIIK